MEQSFIVLYSTVLYSTAQYSFANSEANWRINYQRLELLELLELDNIELRLELN